MNPLHPRIRLAALVLLAGTVPAFSDDVIGTVSPTRLYLRAGEVNADSAVGGLATVCGPVSAGKRYVVQLDGPMTPDRRDRLAAAGVRVGQYLPMHAYIVRLEGADPNMVAALDFVRWHREYEAAWKLDPEMGLRPASTPAGRDLAAADRMLVVVTLFADAGPGAGQRTIGAIAGAVVRGSEMVGGNQTLYAELPVGALGRLAGDPDVQFVEQAPEVLPRNGTTRWIVQSNAAGQFPVYDAGIHGEGQVVGILDGRVDVNHCSFADTQPIGPLHRKITAYNTSLGQDLHGTHVAGIAAGDAGNDGDTRGVAYLSKIVFDDIPSFSESGILTALTLHHNQGGRLHTNSWGNDFTTQYDSLCRGFDVFQHQFEESFVCLAVTNGSSLKNPENAKNLLAVGNSDDTPTQGEHCTGGVGPTSDGRRKPEIYAPGCGSKSSSAGSSCGVTSLTGTSMASPAIAGAAALARQYYADGYYPGGEPNGSDAFTPSGALVKATLLNSAVDMTGVTGYPSNLEGWGRVLLDNSLYFPGDTRRMLVADVRNASGLSTGGSAELAFNVNTADHPLRVTAVWTEPAATAGASFAAVNDLDLVVTDPSGRVYLGNVFSGGQSATGGSRDDRNNVEQVHVLAPEPGAWTVRVVGASVAQGTQGYALLATGDLQSGPAGLSVSLVGGVPGLVAPGQGVPITVRINPGDDELVPGTPTLHYRYDGGLWRTSPLGLVSGNDYTATLPFADCADNPEFYLSAEGVASGLKTSPASAPAAVHAFEVGELVEQTLLSQSFESGLPAGWTTSGLWNIGSNCSPGPTCDGAAWAYYGRSTDCTFDNGARNFGSLTAAPVALPTVPPGGSITLEYCSALETENVLGFDTAEVTANGVVVDTAAESAAFETRAVDLTSLAGQSVTLAWAFDTGDRVANDFRGWHVDLVRITAKSSGCDYCYADCDQSTGAGVLDFFDFVCFQDRFGAGESYGCDCDTSSGLGVCDFFDFICFQDAFAAGCP